MGAVGFGRGGQAQEGAPVQNGEGLGAADAGAPPRKSRESTRSLRLQTAASARSPAPAVAHEAGNGDVTVLLDAAPELISETDNSEMHDAIPSTPNRTVAPNATSNPVPIPSPLASGTHRIGDQTRNLQESTTRGQQREARTPPPTGAPVNGHEGPITPRNDAGPWVFDGSGVRIRISGDGGARVSRPGSCRSRQRGSR